MRCSRASLWLVLLAWLAVVGADLQAQAPPSANSSINSSSRSNATNVSASNTTNTSRSQVAAAHAPDVSPRAALELLGELVPPSDSVLLGAASTLCADNNIEFVPTDCSEVAESFCDHLFDFIAPTSENAQPARVAVTAAPAQQSRRRLLGIPGGKQKNCHPSDLLEDDEVLDVDAAAKFALSLAPPAPQQPDLSGLAPAVASTTSPKQSAQNDDTAASRSLSEATARTVSRQLSRESHPKLLELAKNFSTCVVTADSNRGPEVQGRFMLSMSLDFAAEEVPAFARAFKKDVATAVRSARPGISSETLQGLLQVFNVRTMQLTQPCGSRGRPVTAVQFYSNHPEDVMKADTSLLQVIAGLLKDSPSSFVFEAVFNKFGYAVLPSAFAIVRHAGQPDEEVLKTVCVPMPVPAFAGHALKFDGKGDYVEAPPSPDLDFLARSPFTIEAWFRPRQLPLYNGPGSPGIMSIIARGVFGDVPTMGSTSYSAAGGNTMPPVASKVTASDRFADTKYMLAVNSAGRVGFYRETGVGLSRSVWSDPSHAPAQVGSWTHAAASYDGKKITLVVNGTVVASKVAGPMLEPPAESSFKKMPLFIGARSTVGQLDGHFQGTIDEVRVWSAARTPFETVRDINASLVDTDTLVAVWSFDEGSGDLAGQSEHATGPESVHRTSIMSKLPSGRPFKTTFISDKAGDELSCSKNNGDCSSEATCSPIPAEGTNSNHSSVSCQCNNGFTGDGVVCLRPSTTQSRNGLVVPAKQQVCTSKCRCSLLKAWPLANGVASNNYFDGPKTPQQCARLLCGAWRHRSCEWFTPVTGWNTVGMATWKNTANETIAETKTAPSPGKDTVFLDSGSVGCNDTAGSTSGKPYCRSSYSGVLSWSCGAKYDLSKSGYNRFATLRGNGLCGKSAFFNTTVTNNAFLGGVDHGVGVFGAGVGNQGDPFKPAWVISTSPKGSFCPSQCSGHGKCTNLACVCDPGYAGRDCNKSKCALAANGVMCSGRGKCVDSKGDRGQSYSFCACFPGASGRTCENDVCPGMCNGHGTCDYLNTKRCWCKKGWEGVGCANKACPFKCSGRGTCIQGQCMCNSGFRGKYCEQVRCPGDVVECSANGKCIQTRPFNKNRCTFSQCKCEQGFHGAACNVGKQPDCPFSCFGRGVCNKNLTCECFPGWGGLTQGKAACGHRVCPDGCKSKHGECIDGQCVCKDGWTGLTCNVAPKSCPGKAGAPCNGHGSCVGATDDGDSKCICNRGFSGEDCGTDLCPKACSNHGHCTQFGCQCHKGFQGRDCGTQLSFPLSCRTVCRDGEGGDCLSKCSSV